MPTAPPLWIPSWNWGWQSLASASPPGSHSCLRGQQSLSQWEPRWAPPSTAPSSPGHPGSRGLSSDTQQKLLCPEYRIISHPNRAGREKKPHTSSRARNLGWFLGSFTQGEARAGSAVSQGPSQPVLIHKRCQRTSPLCPAASLCCSFSFSRGNVSPSRYPSCLFIAGKAAELGANNCLGRNRRKKWPLQHIPGWHMPGMLLINSAVGRKTKGEC